MLFHGNAVHPVVVTAVLPVAPANRFIIQIRDAAEHTARHEVVLDEFHKPFDLLSEYSDKLSYPQFFIIRTF